MLELWQQLVTTALLGTERQPFKLESLGGALGALSSQLNSADKESALLSVAATVALYRRVGQLSREARGAIIEPCEPDDLPICSELSTRHLALLLNRVWEWLLPEWLNALIRAKKRVPPTMLVSLLDYSAGKDDDFQELVFTAIGKRGAWLLEQNFQNNWGVLRSINNPEEIWQTGKPLLRLRALKIIRKQDAQPGRELLAESWKQEATEDRARFLEALQINLSLEDEPFLEAALDDKRKEVRKQAAELLARLPDSRFCQRMLERALPLVDYRKGKLRLTLPEECDKAMKRDGIETKVPQTSGTYSAITKIGERAWMLTQILSAVPTQVWRERFKLNAEKLLELANNSEWTAALKISLERSACNFHDEEMAEAWLKDWRGDSQFHWNADNLVNLLKPERRDSLLLEILSSYKNIKDANSEILTSWFYNNKAQWSDNLTRVVLNFLRSRMEAKENWWSVIHNWTHMMSPAVALAELSSWAPEPDEKGREIHFDSIIETLNFRSEMLEELER
jgi:hypothetical protein